MDRIPIRIFSPPPTMQFLAEIRNYESLAITRRFYKSGEFELKINFDKNHTDVLVKNNIVVFGKDGKKAGIIRHRENQTGESSNQDDTLIIKGPTLNGLVHDRLIVPEDNPGSGYDSFAGTQEAIMKHFVMVHCVSPTDTDRTMFGLTVAADQGRGVSDQWRFPIKTFVDDALNQIGTYASLGWDITADLANKQLIFDVVKGVNRTASQNMVPPVQFAAEWSNISAPHLIQGWINSATAGYAVGSDALNHLVQKIGTATGYDRQEQVFDCSDAETTAELLARGNQNLHDAAPIMTFEFNILPDKPFKYGSDFDLGDVVTAYSRKWGVTMDAQITELVETYESAGNTLKATFGTDIPTLTAWIRKQIKKAV